MRTPVSVRAGLAYCVMLPAGIVAAFVLSEATIEAVNGLPRSVRSPNVVGLVINIVPALLAGALVYALTGLWLRRRGWLEAGLVSHVRRTAPLYLFTALCGVVIMRARSSPDFGLWAQIPIWSGLSALGGVGADLMIHRSTGRVNAHAASPNAEADERENYGSHRG